MELPLLHRRGTQHRIVLLQGFKAYFALLFFKGARLPDPSGLLTTITENVQSARHFRRVSAEDVPTFLPALRDLVRGAIEADRSGAKVSPKPADQFAIPTKFQSALDTEFGAADGRSPRD